MHVRFQWLLNLTSSRSSHEGYRKMPSEKEEKEATPAEVVTVLVGEHQERYDLPLEIFNPSTFKILVKGHQDEMELKKKPGLHYCIDDFKNMLTLARVEITKRRASLD